MIRSVTPEDYALLEVELQQTKDALALRQSCLEQATEDNAKLRQQLTHSKDALSQTQLERDNYASQLTLATKWLGEARRKLAQSQEVAGKLAEALRKCNFALGQAIDRAERSSLVGEGPYTWEDACANARLSLALYAAHLPAEPHEPLASSEGLPTDTTPPQGGRD